MVSANYRYAPEHPFPTALDDVAEELGVEAARIVIGGESAGGGLSAALVQRLHDEGARSPSPNGCSLR